MRCSCFINPFKATDGISSFFKVSETKNDRLYNGASKRRKCVKRFMNNYTYFLEAQNIIICLSAFSLTNVYSAASFISKGTKAYS